MRILLVCVMAFLVLGCSGGLGETGAPHDSGAEVVIDNLAEHHLEAKPWTSLEVLDDPDKFQFLVVTDRTGGARDGIFESAVDKIDLLQPAFVMSVGDLIQGYTEDEEVINAQWDEFDVMARGLDAPFFYVPGNHDWSNRTMAAVWEERLGQSYYHFVYKGVLFVVINSELFDRSDAPWWNRPFEQRFAEEQAAQLSYLQTALEANHDVRWTFVFVHKPYWRHRWARPDEGEESPAEGPWPRYDYVPPEWTQVEAMLDDRDYTIFAGHLHTYEYSGPADGPHTHDKIALATTGGVSNLRGPAYGEFDQTVWVTMTADGPHIANLLLDGILEKDFEMPRQRPFWVE